MIVLTVISYILFFIAVIASVIRMVIRKRNIFDRKKRMMIDLFVLGLYVLAFMTHCIGK